MTHLVNGYPYDFEKDHRYSPIYKHQIIQGTCILPGGGCVYYRANKGDVCPFCAFPAFTRSLIRGKGSEDYFNPWTLNASTYKEMYLQSITKMPDIDKLAIFNGGSFFPGSELPSEFQSFVYQDVSKRSHIKQLMVEAYPDYITKTAIKNARELLPSTDLMVGIGFESVDDRVRNKVLKKRIDKTLFESKVKLLQDNNIQVFVYAFLKAPSLNERQAVLEALATINYLNNLGVDEIALSCAFVPPNTELEDQYHKGEFRPPWLWSILEIMDQAKKHHWPLSIGGFEDTPPPIAGPHNCDICDEKSNHYIAHYRRYGHTENISSPSCNCKEQWYREYSQELSLLNT